MYKRASIKEIRFGKLCFWKLVLIFILLSPIVTNAGGNDKVEVRRVVERFCRLDFEGARLSTDAYQPILSLISYPAEPGWDRAIGITWYKIKSVSVEDNEAEVTVNYSIPGIENTLDLKEYETENIKLKKINGCWKISEYIQLPRPSIELLNNME